jgi:copper homeostasis protein
MVMVRPRSAGFLYSGAEFQTMLRDVELFRSNGVEGIVFGVLHADGTVDVERNGELVEAAGPIQTVFHRAFDATPDALAALDDLIRAGFTRVLTSGQAQSAAEGKDLIAKMIARVEGRIEILPGGGLRSGNVAELASIANQVHLGPFARTLDPSTSAKPNVSYGVKELPPENTFGVVDQEEIRATVHHLAQWNRQ